MSKNILLVEDDESICTVVSAALRGEGYTVDICDDSVTRDIFLNENQYDLMITDVILKNSDGIASLSQVKNNFPKLPIIIISAQNSLETAVRASEVEAFEYFPKPFDLNELVDAAQQACQDNANVTNASEAVFDNPSMPIIGRSSAMQDVFRMVVRLLRNDLSVLVLGESGSGKELVAEAIHSLGHRKTGPFVAVNMAAIPSELIESELFGHEKGAFTGAVAQSIGKFEQAQGGTLFLDEIGDMPMHAQTRLLRALQTGAINRVGGKANIKLDVRIVAATNQDLEALISEGKFREDLYYRLNVVPISVPPLRKRRDDIHRLAEYFLSQASDEGLPIKHIDQDAIHTLETLPWRGNVRELKNFIFRLLVTCRTDTITKQAVMQLIEDRPEIAITDSAVGFDDALTHFLSRQSEIDNLNGSLYSVALAEFEKPLLSYIMRKTNNNQLKASAFLGINRNTLRKKLQEYDMGHGK